MSGLGFNKIAGSVLFAGLLAVGLNEIGGMLFHPHELEEPGYKIEVAGAEPADAAGGESEAAPEGPPDFGVALASADVARGASLFKQCQACHSIVDGGANGTGPALWGVVGRASGQHPGFRYSAGMAAYGQAWTFENLYAFLENPKGVVAGTAMAYAGLKRSADRVNLIAYLREQSANPLPIPAPAAPVEAEAAALDAAVAPEGEAPAGEIAPAPEQGG